MKFSIEIKSYMSAITSAIDNNNPIKIIKHKLLTISTSKGVWSLAGGSVWSLGGFIWFAPFGLCLLGLWVGSLIYCGNSCKVFVSTLSGLKVAVGSGGR